MLLTPSNAQLRETASGGPLGALEAAVCTRVALFLLCLEPCLFGSSHALTHPSWSRSMEQRTGTRMLGFPAFAPSRGWEVTKFRRVTLYSHLRDGNVGTP